MCKANSIHKEAAARDYTSTEQFIQEKIEFIHEISILGIGWQFV
jgi:hypothetical protein